VAAHEAAMTTLARALFAAWLDRIVGRRAIDSAPPPAGVGSGA
jgi:hypothetical protein